MTTHNPNIKTTVIGCGEMACHHVRKILRYSPETIFPVLCEPSQQNYEKIGEVEEPGDGDELSASSSLKFGRKDSHGDNNSWGDSTFSYFQHIMIDYTEGKFPLLPDNVPIQNLTDKLTSTNPQISVHANRSMENVIIHVRNISPVLIAETRLKIFDLSGRLINELISQDGK